MYPHRAVGPGVREALWKLTLAMLFKGIITIFTFGIKVKLCFCILSIDIKLYSVSCLENTYIKSAKCFLT